MLEKAGRRARPSRLPYVEPLEGRALLAHLTIVAPGGAAAVAMAGDQSDAHTIALGDTSINQGNDLAHATDSLGLSILAEGSGTVSYVILPGEDLFGFGGKASSSPFLGASQTSQADIGTTGSQSTADIGSLLGVLIEADPGDTVGQPIDVVLSYDAMDPLGHVPPGLMSPPVEGTNSYAVTYADSLAGPVQTLGAGSVQGPQDVTNTVTIHSAVGSVFGIGFKGNATAEPASANSPQVLGGFVVTITASLVPSGGGSTSILPPSSTPPHVTGIQGVGHPKTGVTAITVGFDEAVVPGSATSSHQYTLLGAVKKHGKPVFSKPVAIRGISYDDNAHAVTIDLARPYKGEVQATVHGGILAANGSSSVGDSTAIVK
jgi:hypothetical protein